MSTFWFHFCSFFSFLFFFHFFPLFLLLLWFMCFYIFMLFTFPLFLRLRWFFAEWFRLFIYLFKYLLFLNKYFVHFAYFLVERVSLLHLSRLSHNSQAEFALPTEQQLIHDVLNLSMINQYANIRKYELKEPIFSFYIQLKKK